MYPSKTPPERFADGLIHAISLVGLLVAFAFLLPRAAAAGDSAVLVAAWVYAVAALFSLCISFAYHLSPWHDLRPTLRQWDHAAIYPVIAGVFSPLLITAGTASAYAILSVIWILTLFGVWFKLSGDNGDSRWSLISYLGLGAFALIALPDFWAALPQASTWAILAGAVFYTIGTQFYRKKGMPYRYPIWHFFGSLGGASFFAAIWIALS